ncbi:MAG: hypothetical protein EBR02_09470 [Alphaproteobacteria bacterium]|nr:hypothetical protein [Alphaproteobacteria bacterium]
MDLDTHEKANQIVRTEIFADLSALVLAMASEGDEEAQELTYGVLDYESAAKEAGWALSDNVDTFDDVWVHDERSNQYSDARRLCDAEGIEAHEREVFEHWSVSSWLASQLEKHGEKIARDWYGHHVWARTTTGQSISIDAVIEDVVRAVARGE